MKMKELEKVIKGFTICSEHGLLNGEDCHGHYEYTDNLADIIKANDYSKQCPYNGCKTGCVKTLAKDTIALLKEQEAKPPIWIHDEYLDHACVIDRYKCPKCGRYIIKRAKFCSDCGQAVKWK